MKVQDVARAVMKASGYTQAEVATRAGLPGQGSISMFLQSKSMRIDSFLTILNACGGYDLVVRKKEDDGIEYVIGDETDGPTKRTVERKFDVCNYEEVIRRVVTEELKLRGL